MAKKSKKIPQSNAPQFENDPTPERMARAHGEVHEFKTDSNRRVKRLGSVLDHMLSRGIIDQPQHAAGQLAHKQWYMGGLSPVGAVDLSKIRVDGGGGNDMMGYRLDSVKAFGIAMQAIGQKASRAFREMALHEMSAADYGKKYYGYADRAVATGVAYSMLKDALQSLEIHYTGTTKKPITNIRSHMEPTAKPSNKPELRK